MGKLKMTIVGFLLKKFGLKYLAQGYALLRGYKTQICLAGAGLTWLAETFQWIDHPLAEQLYAVFGGAGSVSLLAKLKGWQDVADAVAKETKEAGT